MEKEKQEEERTDKRDINHSKKYEFQLEKGTSAEVKIEAKIKSLNKADLEEILHELAICTHNFYLSLGKEISIKD